MFLVWNPVICILITILFPRAAVTRDLQLGGLIQQKCILLQFCRPKSKLSLTGLNLGVGRAGCSGGSRGESVSCRSQLLVTAGIPWLVATSLQSLPLASDHLSSSLSNLLCLPPIRTLVIPLGPAQTIRDNFPVSRSFI